MAGDIVSKLNGIEKLEKKLSMQKAALVNKAIHSTDPNVLLKANDVLQTIETRPVSDRKSLLLDPNDMNNFMGYKEKPVALTYHHLRRISYAVPIIRSIINTRIDQITAFCEPQKDKYSTGFVVRKKQPYYDGEAVKLSRKEIARANQITDIILNCGTKGSWAEDDFDQFTRKIWNDSYTFDQMNFEVVRDRRGKLFEFLAAPADTIRIADSYDNDKYDNEERASSLDRRKVKGYYPSFCQVIDGQVKADYYPWELCMGIRNPTTSIYSNGYGVAEIEILVNTITSMLWGDEYNRRFFSQGSAPKGLLKVKNGGGLQGGKITEFKQKWQAMMGGVYNSWKTPILEADVDWIDLQKNNRDMEYSNWIEFQIKIACATYRIDPAEVNFPLSGGAEQKAMFEGNNEARLKHSKDKGLRPAVKFYNRKLNKFVVSQIDPEYELVFVGLDNDDPNVDLDNDVKQVANFCTVDEIRIKRGMKPLGPENGGDMVLNPVWMQNKTTSMQMDMQEKQMNVSQQQFDTQMDMQQDDVEKGITNEENPFAEAFTKYASTLFGEK